MCEVSKDADSKMFNGFKSILEVWTIWSPLEAVKENKRLFFKLTLKIKCWVPEDADSKMFKNAFYNNFGCWLDHMEVTRGHLRRLEAVFERFCGHRV